MIDKASTDPSRYCPDGFQHVWTLKPNAANSFCERCGYFPGPERSQNREVAHTEKGTPSQVINAWDRLAREDERPS